MVDFSKKNTKEAGGKFDDKDWTTSEGKWLEETSKGGFTGVYYQSTLVGVDGVSQDKKWLLMSADDLRQQFGMVVNDDGQLEVIDEDLAEKFQPKTSQDVTNFFNSCEDAGVPVKVINSLPSNPGALDGYTLHLIEKPTGKKQMKLNERTGKKEETQYDQTRLVVADDGLVSAPGKGGAGKSASAKPSAAAAQKTGKARTPPNNDEEEEEEEIDEEDAETDPIELAAIATVQNVLAGPKKFVGTYNPKANGGGVTTAQMSAAALGNAIPKEHREVGKPKVQKLVKSADFGEKYSGELWNFDADEGVYSALD